MTLAIVLVAMGSSGCAGLSATRIKTEDLGLKPTAGSQTAITLDGNIGGLAVNVNVPHRVYALFRERPESDTIVEAEVPALLPSQTEIYSISYKGALFTTRALKIELHPDTTIKNVTYTSDLDLAKELSDVAEATGQVSASVKDLGEAKKAIKDAEKKPSPTDIENSQLKLEIMNGMLKANREAAANGLPLPYPGVY